MPERNHNGRGYGEPPLHSRFKPGQSGNPKGRPKRRRTLVDELREELLQEIEIKENSKTIKLTKQRRIAKALVDKASKGDMRAIAAIMSVSDAQDDSSSDSAVFDEMKVLKDYEDDLARSTAEGHAETEDVAANRAEATENPDGK